MFGAGADLSDKAALKGKAKRKLVTQLIILSLIEVAKKKGATDRMQAYRNTLYCLDKVYNFDGRIYGRFCKNHFCTVCCSIRKAEIINRYFPVISSWEEPRFVTLTETTVPATRLNLWFHGVNKAFRQIREKYKKRNQRGNGINLRSFG